MKTETLRLYFSALVTAQTGLMAARSCLGTHSAFSYFRAITPQSTLTPHIMKSFLNGFAPSLHLPAASASHTAMHPPATYDSKQILDHAVGLLFSEGTMNLQQFSMMLRGQAELPAPPRDLDFALKKKLFQFIQIELQNQLNIDTVKMTLLTQCEDLSALFATIADQQCITVTTIKNLFLGAGQRKSEDFFRVLQSRFKLPCKEDRFKSIFRTKPMGVKIHYSEKRKNQISATPQRKKRRDVLDSTKYKTTKSKGVSEEAGVTPFHTEIVGYKRVLGEMIMKEQHLDELKADVLFSRNFDLELLYGTYGQQLQPLLLQKYSTCNFTSFVRYMVPHTYDHQYYAFIKYSKSQKISPEIISKMNILLEEQKIATEYIQSLWAKTDKQILFRHYCAPNQSAILCKNMQKHFTKKQCEKIFDRMDPHKTSYIQYEMFK